MIILIMGVTGSGKTTIGTLLAQQLGWRFADADDFHSPANKEKMSKAIPLSDADRLPWLQAIHTAMVKWNQAGESLVLACSALKQSYRELLTKDLPVCLVYLQGNAAYIKERLQHRTAHYAKADLVDSQFAALEEPGDAVVVDTHATPEKITEVIRRRLGFA
jgi:gluconokinase